MTTLQNICKTTARIPKQFRDILTLDEIREDLRSLDWSVVTNPHIFNLRSLVNPTDCVVSSVEESGMAFTVDLSISASTHSYMANGIPVHNTVNVPNNYNFEDFKDIYLESYRSGYVKGVTTYRSGTMTTVLSAKEEKMANAAEEEIILEDVKVPSQAPAVMNVMKAEGKKYYLTAVMDVNNKRPIALFVQTNHHEKTSTTHDAVERLISLARNKGIPKKWILDTEEKIQTENNVTKLARSISLLLRHGVFIKSIVHTLNQVEDVYVGTFLFQIRKYLSHFVQDGEKMEGVKCANCESTNIVFSEGCAKCLSCGNSRCS